MESVGLPMGAGNGRAELAYLFEMPWAKRVLASIQPVRLPGPQILLKLPLLTEFPKPSALQRSAPPSSCLSMSTIRGRMAFSGCFDSCSVEGT